MYYWSMSGHHHNHSHAGSPGESHQGRIAVALGITLAVFVFQVIGSILTGSLALLFDSAHVLTDAGGLAMALLAARLMTRPATSRRTWGFARAEVLAATAQAAVLLAVGLVVLVEGIQRLFDPAVISSNEMIVFGAIGLAGNVISLFVLMGGRNNNFNMRAAFLEVLNDALGSVAVIVAAIVISTTGWMQADAVAAMLIGALILPRTVKLLFETISVLLESTPTGLDLNDVREHILAVDHVRGVHDLHASQIATGLPILQSCVAEHFAVSIEHSTFQLEPVGHAAHELGAHH